MTDGASDSLADSIRNLEDRLAAVERTLAAIQQHQSPAHPAPVVPAIPIAPASAIPQPPPLPPSAVLPKIPKTFSMQPRYAPSRLPKFTKPPGLTLEAKIGKNLASWIGAIVL